MNDFSTASDVTDLVVIEPGSALTVFTVDGAVDPLLARIRQEIDAFTPDISTADGRKRVASMAYKVARAKTYLDNAGKGLVEDMKKLPKTIDAARKRVRDTLDEWRDEVRAPLTVWEQAEEDRVNRHKAALAEFQSIALLTPECEIERLRERQAWATAFSIDDACEEFAAEYAVSRDAAVKAVAATIAKREARDAEQAELARLRAESLARQQKDREAAIAREAADRAKAEAEARATADRAAAVRRELELRLRTEQALRRADEAIAQAKVEADRKAATDAAEAAKREADKAHIAKINRAVAGALVGGGIDEATAKRVVTLIAQKAVPHVAIFY